MLIQITSSEDDLDKNGSSYDVFGKKATYPFSFTPVFFACTRITDVQFERGQRREPRRAGPLYSGLFMGRIQHRGRLCWASSRRAAHANVSTFCKRFTILHVLFVNSHRTCNFSLASYQFMLKALLYHLEFFLNLEYLECDNFFSY